MDWYLLQPGSVLALSQAMLLLVFGLYLLSIRPKSRGTLLLAIVFGILGILWLERAVVGASLFFLWSTYVVLPLVFYLLLHFAYSFAYNPFRRESRIVLTGAGLLVGANVVYQIVNFDEILFLPQGVGLCVQLGGLLMIIGSLSVYLRKRARLSKGMDLNRSGKTGADEAEQTGKEMQALRAFALLMAGMMLVHSVMVWREGSFIWGGPGIWGLSGRAVPFNVDFAAWAVILVLFVVVYINHMPEPTTFRAKIAGISLVTLLAVFGLADLMLFSEADLQRESMALLPSHQTLRFEPDGQGGYRVGHAPFRFDPDLGDNLSLGANTDSLVSLGFSFPFYETRWEEMYIDSNGQVTFGGGQRSGGFYSDEHPKIAPYKRTLFPIATRQGGVFYRRETDRVTVTWFMVLEPHIDVPSNRNTIQLVLYEHGAIDFVYDRMEAHFDDTRGENLRGLHPGGATLPQEQARFASLPPEIVTVAIMPERRAVRFEPRGDEGYGLAQIPFHFDRDLGEDLRLGDDTNALVTLDFSFPFYENLWEEVYVSINGAVAFGGPINPPDTLRYRPLQDFYNEQPKIAPLFVDFDSTRGGGVFYKREADKATFTWHQIKRHVGPERNTVQLVLHESGAVDFVYDQVQVPLRGTDLWGLYPGDTRPRIEAAEYLFDVNAYSAPAGTIVVEDFNLLYRRFVHAKIVPLAYMVLGGTLFILGVFPLFFRTSLIKPLEALLLGVRRVDEGDLDTPVPVRVNDEIGILAQNFNRMTASLKAAEDELRAYAEGLEEKVSERTADLRQAQDQLIHAEKMASMGQLTAGIAHEIKNPLNFVNNFAQLSVELADELVEKLKVSEGRPPDDMQDLLADLKQNAERIHDHGRRADDIVRSMLDHSRGGAGERRATDVNELVEEYAELAYHSMRASAPGFNVTIEHDFDESVGKIVMAPREIGRVLLNLLNNAFYAVHDRALGDDSFSPTVLVRTLRDGTQVEIHVSDNGPGIDEALREKIFEPFFTTKPAGSGAGLGLSLSYDIVTQGHGGTLIVESEEGQGATFIISLPVG